MNKRFRLTCQLCGEHKELWEDKWRFKLCQDCYFERFNKNK